MTLRSRAQARMCGPGQRRNPSLAGFSDTGEMTGPIAFFCNGADHPLVIWGTSTKQFMLGKSPSNLGHPLTSSTLLPLLEPQPQNEKKKTMALLSTDSDIANTLNGPENGKQQDRLSDIGAMELKIALSREQEFRSSFLDQISKTCVAVWTVI